jgi:glycosyltransferase involved in cell wall biosynthesis
VHRLPITFQQGFRRKAFGALYGGLSEWAVLVARRMAGSAAVVPEPGPLMVSGFFTEPTGLGRAADLTLAALERAGLAPRSLHVRELLAGNHAPLSGHGDGGALILHCNPDEAARVLARTPAHAWRHKLRIGYWAWELPVVPDRWRRTADLFHEIWAPSRFIADALIAGGVRRPVRVMPHPVDIGTIRPAADKARWDLPEDGFTILIMSDFRSSTTRKNLDGAVEIVRRAIEPGSNATLVLKTLASDSDQLAHLRERLAGRIAVKFLTEPLDQADTLSLMASVDLLLSPHRSEGFGLALAEAFLVGTPALATGWSGNMEFMQDLSPLLIDFRLVPVGDPTGVYSSSQRWAEPSMDDAVAKLRVLAQSPALRQGLASRGAATLVRQSAAWEREKLASGVLGPLLG